MNNTRDDDALKKFGAHLKKLRNERELSLRELSAEINVEYSHINRIEKGEVNPSYTMLIIIAAGLDITLQELISVADVQGKQKGRR